MADTKVKISHILDSQIPDFIHEENPLFKEFLNQYYISQEHEYGNVDLAENITDVKNISNFIDLNIVGYQALAPIQLSEDISSFDDEITVNRSEGFFLGSLNRPANPNLDIFVAFSDGIKKLWYTT